MAVDGAPYNQKQKAYEYARPFKRQGRDWLNPNVRGSLGWSSNQRKTLLLFLEHREDEEPNYALRPNNSTLARDALLKKERVPIEALVAFLYRDFAFKADSPSFVPLLDRFAREFDFRADGGGFTSEFRVLFSELPDDLDADDWFEPCEPAPAPDTQEADDEA